MSINIFIKHYKNLKSEEIKKIFEVRNKVFILEQKIPEPDQDEYDKKSYHAFIQNDQNIISYLRIIPANIRFRQVSIGRVLSIDRNKGYAKELINHTFRFIKNNLLVNEVLIHSQINVVNFYIKLGFIVTSKPFIESGIMHVEMIKKL